MSPRLNEYAQFVEQMTHERIGILQRELTIAHFTLGLCGELGEIKSDFDATQKITSNELGDLLFYTVGLINLLEGSLSTAFDLRSAKLPSKTSKYGKRKLIIESLTANILMVAEFAKKVVFVGKPNRETDMLERLYAIAKRILQLAHLNGTTISRLIDANVHKLTTRHSGTQYDPNVKD